MRDKENYPIYVTALNGADLFIYFSILGHPPETIIDSLLKLYTMKTQKFFEFLLLFISFVKITTSWIIKSDDNYSSTLSNTTVHLLKFCYEDCEKVVVNSNADGSIIKNMHDFEKVAVILHDNASRVDQKLQYKHKVDSFIVTLDESIEKLVEILRSFEKSPWWNIMTPYFILSGSKNGCSDAQTVLQTVWKMNILNCYFVCLDLEQKQFIYTFNPYSKFAPDQWKLVDEIKNGSYMAIYNRPYKKEIICKGFNFDKTKHLDKTTINIVGCIYHSKKHAAKNVKMKSKKNNSLNFFQAQVMKALKTSFKSSFKIVYDFEAPESGKPYGVFNHLKNRSSDFVMCLKIHSMLHNYPASYHILYNYYTILSNNQGYLTPLEKIYNYYDVLMISATIILSLITYLVIWYRRKPRDFSFAAFEILRLWTSNSLNTRIESLAMRLFFFVIFLYFLIIQATFQGHLVEFLTKTELRKNADSLADLESAIYEKIYVTKVSKPMIENNSILVSKSHVTGFMTCLTAVSTDRANICIGDYSVTLKILRELNWSKKTLQNLYLSKNSLRNSYALYATRHDWPLKQRFDKFLMSLEDSGVSQKLSSNLTAYLESLMSAPKYDTNFRPISLDSLSFIFYFWIIGILCSILSFIVEKFFVNRNLNRIIKSDNHNRENVIKEIPSVGNKIITFRFLRKIPHPIMRNAL